MMEWISVDDRFPEENGNYLIYGDTGVIVGEWSGGDSKFAWGCVCTTHWMPLPEPPKD